MQEQLYEARNQQKKWV